MNQRQLFTRLLVSGLFFLPVAVLARDSGPMRIFGPEGQAATVAKCAQIFGQENGLAVTVKTGPPAGWLGQAKASADVIFGGAGFSVDDFAGRYSCLVDATSRAEFAGGVPVYATHFVKHKEAARHFIDFLNSAACRAIWAGD